MYTTRHSLLLAFLTVSLLAAGCDTAQPDEADTGASADVAASVAALVSDDTGGLIDQVGDVIDLAAAGEITVQTATLAGKYADASDFEKTYDETTGTWTIAFTREHDSPDGLRHLNVHRTYEVQFLNASGAPQQFFVTQGDTAHSIAFAIVEGSGTLETPHLSAERTDITGAWLATGTHTDEVTVNGTYGRSGGHTLTTANAVRTLTYDLAVEVTDLVGPKGSRRDLSQKVSGTVHGTYVGTATFERGDLYRERDIERDVTVVIENGEAIITVNGETFVGNATTGDLR